MRPLRFLLMIATSVLAFFGLLFLGPFRQTQTPTPALSQSRLGAYFNWRTPSSLFPPSAIISLTDDNSTFFLARPAAFGPLLPVKSLSGQLWVGSGFGDDHLGRSAAGGAEGELGCSDVPGWRDGEVNGAKKSVPEGKAESKEEGKERPKRGLIDEDEEVVEDSEALSIEDDGTDDHLHHPLSPSEAVKQNGAAAAAIAGKKPGHADIQSLQESAEISGKVVLLSRGGCGFLEKAKWVQRRGGVALIVGDDIRGGPLVTMYARGDTSNITIPALFTSHTTAHLLSSLIPFHHGSEDLTAEDLTRLGMALGDKATGTEASGKKAAAIEKPNFSSTTISAKATATAKAKAGLKKSTAKPKKSGDSEQDDEGRWIWTLLGSGGVDNGPADSSRPPASGKLNWVLQQEFEEEESPKQVKVGKAAQTTSTVAKAASTKKPTKQADDDFVIGVQDWRDADLVAEQREQQLKQAAGTSSTSTSQPSAKSTKAVTHGGPRGGSIVPGSGEYVKVPHHAVDVGTPVQGKSEARTKHQKPRQNLHSEDSRSWLRRVFSSSSNRHHDVQSEQHTTAATSPKKPAISPAQHAHTKDIQPSKDKDDEPEHTGLWVTLTPTSMSSSPFFDTLLVLVVSPLVTLTVVYALLLLRSRIRRRRWRAPKSVVERLPVRTYQTMGTSSSTHSSASTSPIRAVEAPSPAAPTLTSPLLPSASRPIRMPRQRERLAMPPTSSSAPETLPSQPLPTTALAQDLTHHWRRKQRECVVCLEEYIDGISRVMSLPCGHEFHEGCITPWLVTRRRTCPICKGDVVRSLGTSGGSGAGGRGAESVEREGSLVEVSLVGEEGGEDLERGREG
ncbi:hypothetical protein B0A48_17050 [Cryoendolithus antarcticus]|uniref:RING-type E3 ubiquitin transferase n=1 Tax=Cryoendolithus antarcticus TaxID=1507870 RepID=A0A1V8SCH4_9PEZI|nr:hypothetical protein B0A48_17050 [Cryoendolithus antarcticus]